MSFQSSVLRHFVIAHIYDTKKLPVPSRYFSYGVNHGLSALKGTA